VLKIASLESMAIARTITVPVGSTVEIEELF